MAANLLIPKVEVFWGKTNLTSYTGGPFEGESLVYKVEFRQDKQNNGPTASMMWNPSGAAYAVYEKLLKDSIQEKITIVVYYTGGKQIKTTWMWSGQTISYGNDMSVKVAMQSMLAAKVNGTVRSTNQTKTDSGGTYRAGVDGLADKWKVDKDLIQWNESAKTEAEKAKYLHSYHANSSYGSAVHHFANGLGHSVYGTNIGSSAGNLVVFTPYSTSKDKVEDASEAPAGKDPDPKKRYGFLLGPSVINRFERTYTWTPPQQDHQNKAHRQHKPKNPKKKRGETNESYQQRVLAAENDKKAATPAYSNNATNPAVRDKDNPYGATNILAAKNESTAKLQFSTFLVPVLVGIKPEDIVFIPSLNGEYLEDWKVVSVDYNQTDGGVEVSINAERVYGLSKTMNEEAAKPFKEKAKKICKGGLEAWDKYAWALSPTPQQSVASSTSEAK